MKKHFDLWVYKYPAFKKLIKELKITIILLLIAVNIFETKNLDNSTVTTTWR